MRGTQRDSEWDPWEGDPGGTQVKASEGDQGGPQGVLGVTRSRTDPWLKNGCQATNRPWRSFQSHTYSSLRSSSRFVLKFLVVDITSRLFQKLHHWTDP